MVIKVNPTWDVGRIKQEIAQRRSLQARDFKIVFAGQTLADNLTLWVSAAGCERVRGYGGLGVCS